MAPSSASRKGPLTHSDSQEGSRVKNFKLGEVLGKGSAGTVYKSLNMDTGDVVAIKQVPLRNIPKGDIGQIMREIHLLNHLDHNNIVKYMDSVKTKDHLNIVLEFVENGSLANTVKRFGSLPESLIAIYVEQVLQGLCYLHNQGVIHRDIKGANILTTKEGHVKLADFGVAKRLGEVSTGKAAWGQDDVAGTPYWMAPEVIEMSPASTASDIWGVGATIIELLTGAPPYFSLAALPALFRIVQDPHPPLPDSISPALRDFLMQCFRKDPVTRLTARKLLEHQWLQTSVARRTERATAGQDWSAVVERTLELHEAARNKERRMGGGTRRAPRVRPYIRGAGVVSPKDDRLKGRQGRGQQMGVSSSLRKSASEGENMNEMIVGGGGGSDDSCGISAGRRGSEVVEDDEDGDGDGVGDGDDEGEGEGDEGGLGREWDEGVEGGEWGRVWEGRQRRGRSLSDFAENEDDDDGMGDVVLPLGSPKMKTRGGSGMMSVSRAAVINSIKARRGGLDHINLRMNGGARAKRAQRLERYAESEEGDMFELDFEEDDSLLGGGVDEHGSGRFQSLLQRRLTCAPSGDEEESEDGLDFGDDDDMSEMSMTADGSVGVNGHGSSVEADLLALASKLDPDGDEVEQSRTCQDIEFLIRENPEGKRAMMMRNQVLPVLEMLDSASASVVLRALRLVHEAMTDRQRRTRGGEGGEGEKYLGAVGVNEPMVERMCTVGLINRLLERCGVEGEGEDAEAWKMVQQQAAMVIHSICWGRSHAQIQMVVACKGIPVLVKLLSADEPVNHVAFDCLWAITLLPPPTPKMDLCRLMARAKASPPLAKLLEKSVMEGARGVGAGAADVGEWVNMAWQQADRVSHLLALFSQGDHVIKADLADISVLSSLLGVVERGYETLPKIVQKSYLKVLQCLRHLSIEPSAMEPLQLAGACRILVPLISGVARAQGMKHLSREVQSQAMFALYNLCKVNKERQEQAARAGLVPHAQVLASTDGPLRQLAVPLLCDLAHAGRDARAELWRHGAVKTFIQLLEHGYWHSIALNALATWLTCETNPCYLEEELAKPECVDAVVECIDQSETATMSSLLSPLLNLLQSERINKIYGETKLVSGLLLRMKHPEAVVRKMIIECVQSIYAASIDPRAFIMAHELIEIVETLVQEDESRLVQEQGKLLLRAMYINVVL